MYMTIEAGGSKCYKQGKSMNMCIREVDVVQFTYGLIWS